MRSATLRKEIPKPICACCGGPRSQYSAGWCKACYSKKSRPAAFDPNNRGTSDQQRWHQWQDYYATRAVEAEAREVARAKVVVERMALLERRQYAAASRAEYWAEHRRANAEWRDLKLKEAAERKQAKKRLAVTKRVIARREYAAPLAYPYVSRPSPENADLCLVNSLVPQMPGREDICQEVMIALWEKRVSLDDIKANRKNLQQFVRAFRRDNFERSGYALSLDEPMRDGRSWHDVLADPSSV